MSLDQALLRLRQAGYRADFIRGFIEVTDSAEETFFKTISVTRGYVYSGEVQRLLERKQGGDEDGA